MILELKDGNEIYLVDPTLWDALEGEPCCGPRLLVTCVNRQGTLFLWPLRLADASGKIDEWSQSALEACSLATDAWTRVTANVNRGAYDPSTPVHADLGVPKWPNSPWSKSSRSRSRIGTSTDLNHPVLRNSAASVKLCFIISARFGSWTSSSPGRRASSHTRSAWWLANIEVARPSGFRDDELIQLRTPPFRGGAGALYIAYYASAEIGCHLALDWPVPQRILDLYVEFRALTNGLPTPAGRGLLGALAFYDLDALDAIEKDSMRRPRAAAARGQAEERAALLDYCESDVLALGAAAGHAADARSATGSAPGPVHGRGSADRTCRCPDRHHDSARLPAHWDRVLEDLSSGNRTSMTCTRVRRSSCGDLWSGSRTPTSRGPFSTPAPLALDGDTFAMMATLEPGRGAQ